ncbi:MAG TPA: hypothetical protein VFH48_18600 [Chloroflexota bacterium]|nr:hypothetical protein [Chloroflexota bacterium]
MREQTRTGLWVAYGGVASKLVGLTWDAVLHSLDPNLAATEGIFTLVNPSHSLITLGLGLTVAGLIFELLADVQGLRRAPWATMRPVVGSFVLLVLLGVMSGTGLVSAGSTTTHDHRHAGGQGDMAASAGAGPHAHGTAEEQLASAAKDPLLAPLLKIMRQGGTGAALDHLEEVARHDVSIQESAHGLVHSLGRLSLALYGDVSEAFRQCRETFASGCYHGVLEAHLASQPRLEPRSIADLCTKTVPDDSATILKFQCVHGLGHGLVANVDADNPKALRFCDALPGDWDRSSCYGGVFMENIMIEWHLRFGAPADGGGHVHYTQKSMLREDDPLYPCNAVAEKYRRECYFIQTSAISMFNDNDFRATAQACDRAPSKHIPTCYQSLGRDISGFTLRDPQRSVDLCLLGDDRYEGHCITGVVREIINFSWRTDDGFAFCSTVPEASRALCYKGVGEHVDSLFPDRAQKASECARAPEAYRASCDEGARLVRQS